MASPVTTTPGACTVWAVLSCLAIRSRIKIAKRTSRQWFWSDRKCAEQRRVVAGICEHGGGDYRFVISTVNENFVMFERFLLNQLNPKSLAFEQGLEFPDRVADGTRTRNNQNHNLGLYH